MKSAKKAPSKRHQASSVPAIYWAVIGDEHLGHFDSREAAYAALKPHLSRRWENGTSAFITMRRGKDHYDSLTYIRDPRGWVDVTDKDPWVKMTVELRARGELPD